MGLGPELIYDVAAHYSEEEALQSLDRVLLELGADPSLDDVEEVIAENQGIMLERISDAYRFSKDPAEKERLRHEREALKALVQRFGWPEGESQVLSNSLLYDLWLRIVDVVAMFVTGSELKR